MSKFEILFYFTKENRYSVNSLLASIEDMDLPPVYLLERIDDIKNYVREKANQRNKLILFFSLNSIQAVHLENIFKDLRSIGENNLIMIAGGPHATGLPGHLLDIGFDIVALHDGEEVIRDLISSFIKGKDLRDVKSIIFKSEKNDIIKTEKAHTVDINKFRSFPVVRWKIFSPIEISRGCPYGCHYCQTPQIFGRRMRHRSVEKILEMVEIMVKAGKKDVRFITPNALAYGSKGASLEYEKIRELLRNVRNVIGKEGRIFFGTFPSEIRPEFVNEEAVNIIKGFADNDNVTIGAQSGSSRLLEKIGRKHSPEDVIRAVKLFVNSGYKVNVDLIFGLPEEKEEDLEETLLFVETLVNLGVRIHAHYFLPLPGTSLAVNSPKPVPRKILEKLEDLTGKGHIFGNWKEQMRIASSLVILNKIYAFQLWN
jgi:B12-binding domain/radical SAM domain protein